MPKKHLTLLDTIVKDKLRYRYGRGWNEILQDVIDDYGSITERSVFRALSRLFKMGLATKRYNHYDDRMEWFAK